MIKELFFQMISGGFSAVDLKQNRAVANVPDIRCVELLAEEEELSKANDMLLRTFSSFRVIGVVPPRKMNGGTFKSMFWSSGVLRMFKKHFRLRPLTYRPSRNSPGHPEGTRRVDQGGRMKAIQAEHLHADPLLFSRKCGIFVGFMGDDNLFN